MNQYWIDLHIHTCLSPCGSLDMSPSIIVQNAIKSGLSAIAITDHNCTLQCREIQALGTEAGLTVFAGVEVSTKEEAHCIVLFPSEDVRQKFQLYLDKYLPQIPNDTERFGDQVWVNQKNEIQGEYPYLLINAIQQSINEVAAYAKQLDCIFIPAHVERPSYSIISQLGFIHDSLPIDGIEYHNLRNFEKLKKNHTYLDKYVQYSASDAHYPEQIGDPCALLTAPSLTFDNLGKAFLQEDGCTITSFFDNDF